MPYARQLVVALIDGRKVKHHGAVIDWSMPRTFLDDPTVSTADKDKARRQLGESQTAENLHDKHEDTSELLVVEDYDPGNPDEVSAKLIAGLGRVVPLPPNSRLYLVGHHDPDTQRMAGLCPERMARALALGRKVSRVKRVTLVACHTAGEAAGADAAPALLNPGTATFASRLHTALGKTYGIFCEMAAYTSYVTISAMGQKRMRFDPDAARESKLARSKVLYTWDRAHMNFTQRRNMVYEGG